MDQVKAELKAGKMPPEARPHREWGGHFEHGSGFGIHLPNGHWMAIFVDKRMHKGNENARKQVVKEQVNKPIAYGITEQGKVWRIVSEPITEDGDDGHFGLAVYTEQGKAIAAGSGRVQAGGDMTFQSETLYPGVTNAAPLTYKVEGSVDANGDWKITGSVSYSPSK